MIYSEVTIQKEDLEIHLRSLDHDEGIRIDLKDDIHIFINRWSAVYTIDVSSYDNSRQNKDEFYCFKKPEKVMEFLKETAFCDAKQEPSIYAY